MSTNTTPFSLFLRMLDMRLDEIEAIVFAFTPDYLATPHPIGKTQRSRAPGFDHIESTQIYQKLLEAHLAKNGKYDLWKTLGVKDQKGEPIQYAMNHEFGLAYKPHVVSEEHLNEAIASGEKELYRGVADRPGEYDLTSEQMAEEFRTGDFYAGCGLRGNGTYTAADEYGLGEAQRFAEGGFGGDAEGPGTVMRMSLKKDAKVTDYETLRRQQKSVTHKLDAEMADPPEHLSGAELRQYHAERQVKLTIVKDIGRYAALEGYDAYHIADWHEYVILNRSAVRVQDTNIPDR